MPLLEYKNQHQFNYPQSYLAFILMVHSVCSFHMFSYVVRERFTGFPLIKTFYS